MVSLFYCIQQLLIILRTPVLTLVD